MSRALNVMVFAAFAASATPVAAQSCPSQYAACDNGGCCLSAEQCCPKSENGCCSASTPFCCGDGTCAATPSQCQLGGRLVCDGYDVPCGPGCAPAGSDCCDLDGHYCPPESMCTSGTTCVRGAMATIALVVAAASPPPGGEVDESVSPPFDDPEDATDRSCSLVAAPSSRPTQSWPWLFAASLGLLWRVRRTRR